MTVLDTNVVVERVRSTREIPESITAATLAVDIPPDSGLQGVQGK